MRKKILKSAVIALAGIGLVAGSALATPVDFEMGSSSWIDTSETDAGLIMWSNVWDSVQNVGFTLDLDATSIYSDSYTFSFAMLGTTEDAVNNDDLIPQNITAWLDFDIPTDSNEDVDGTTVGFASGLWDYTQGWEVNWQDPVSVVLANGISFDIELSDTGFQSGLWQGPDGICGNAWANVTATVTLTSEAAPVPEPATMLLFGTGLAGLAGAARRKKAAKKS